MLMGWLPRISGKLTTLSMGVAVLMLGGRSGAEEELKAKKLDFLPFSDLEKAVRDDVAFLKGSKQIPHEVPVSGWVYEVETGKTRRVV
jgi:carbonic anhydrase